MKLSDILKSSKAIQNRSKRKQFIQQKTAARFDAVNTDNQEELDALNQDVTELIQTMKEEEAKLKSLQE